MSDPLRFTDLFLFVVLPYVAVAIGIAGTIERYWLHPYSCSSHSSQFLEGRQHFWAEMPFHYGILVVLLGHLIVVLAPAGVMAWTGLPGRRMVVEAVTLGFGLLALGGLAAIIVRRVSNPGVRAVTGPLDWVVYALLAVQIGGGVALAIAYPWGASWFASAVTPYVRSLLRFQPDAAALAAMPALIKLHVVAAYVLLAAFPFSRLVHVAAVPHWYLWRRPQVVRWRRPRAAPAGGKA